MFWANLERKRRRKRDAFPTPAGHSSQNRLLINIKGLFFQNLLNAVADFQQIKTCGIRLHVQGDVRVTAVHHLQQLSIHIVKCHFPRPLLP